MFHLQAGQAPRLNHRATTPMMAAMPVSRVSRSHIEGGESSMPGRYFFLALNHIAQSNRRANSNVPSLRLRAIDKAGPALLQT